MVGFGPGARSDDDRTVLEATADGWWYAARLPNGTAVAAFMTDDDLLPRGHDNVRRFWEERLQTAPLARAVWADPTDVSDLQVRFAGSVRLDRVGGPVWIALGDAAAAFDPLSAQGILKALESGERGAAQIAALLHENVNAANTYSAWLDATFATYLRNYFHYYRQVTRWPASTFWQRRQRTPAPEAATERTVE